ncbi:MAG: DCC1-like thiol-disulfide oxidoreductase family protein [Myxococcota bacterium]
MEATGKRLVLYDGVCGLCDKSVQWLLENDPEGRLRFAPLQGDTAAEVLARHPEVGDIDSIIYVEGTGDDEKVYWRSQAIFRLARHLQTGWRRLAIFRFVPAFLTDLGYRLIAKLRYRIWGKLDSCRIPTPDERARFLP